MQIFVYFSSTCFGLIRPSSGAIEFIISFINAAYGVLGAARCLEDKFYCSWRWAYKPETCRAKINKYLHQVGNWLLFQTKCKVQPSKIRCMLHEVTSKHVEKNNKLVWMHCVHKMHTLYILCTVFISHGAITDFIFCQKNLNPLTVFVSDLNVYTYTPLIPQWNHNFVLKTKIYQSFWD